MTGPDRPRTGRRVPARVAGPLLAAIVLGVLAPATRDPAAAPATPAQAALAVRTLEELGSYGQAADQLRALRGMISPDADLDLWWAIDLARAGSPDSAARILREPLLRKALADTADARRFQTYGWRHEGVFLNGRFDGWYWYVARARAEVDASLGRWNDALDAARTCTDARPLAGFEWYLRSLCAARAGQPDEALDAAQRARRLSPTIPEARYLLGVLEWRAGRRAAAREEFLAAIDLDSTYRAPALALARVRLPLAPDTLPARLLHGVREAALLTSSITPKYDDFEQLDGSVAVTQRDSVAIPDSLAGRVRPFTAHPMALVDTRGRVVFHEDPWTRAGSVPEDVVGMVSSCLRRWRLQPGTRLGRPVPMWVDLEVQVGS